MKIWEMGEGEGSFCHEEESKGQNINFCNAKTKSNGHQNKREHKKLLDIVRNLKI
jgi:hypothetical protein